MIAAAVILVAFLGLSMVWLGVRGRRLDDHPVCRRCKYDLSGLDAPANCPECGSELTKKRRVRIGQRRRRPIVIALGALLLVASLTGGVFELRGFDWTPYKPVRLLLLEADYGDSARADAAVQELVRRLGAGQLNEAQIDEIIENALRIQADAAIDWLPAWGDCIEVAWTMSRLKEEQAERYVREGFNASIFIDTRRRVREGQPLAVRLRAESGRFGSTGRRGPNQWLNAMCTSVRSSESPHAEVEISNRLHVSLRQHRFARSPSRPGFHDQDATATLAHSLGKGQLTLQFTIDMHAVYQFEQQHRYKNWQIEIPVAVEVVGRDQPVISLTPNDLLLSQIRDSINVEIVHGWRQHGEARDGGFVSFTRPPVHVSFDVYARFEGEEDKIGSVACVADEAMTQYLHVHPSDVFPDARFVDLIFRASPTAAEQTIDIDEIWDGEIVIENVRVVFELDLPPRE